MPVVLFDSEVTEDSDGIGISIDFLVGVWLVMVIVRIGGDCRIVGKQDGRREGTIYHYLRQEIRYIYKYIRKRETDKM